MLSLRVQTGIVPSYPIHMEIARLSQGCYKVVTQLLWQCCLSPNLLYTCLAHCCNNHAISIWKIAPQCCCANPVYSGLLPQSVNCTLSFYRLLYVFCHSALNPDPVENLKVHVDPCIPSVTLTWAPSQNSGVASPDLCSDVSRYYIRFKERGTRRYKKMTVDGSTTSLVLKRESGLTPHTTFIFEVKAQSGKFRGQWKTVSAFVGELDESLIVKSTQFDFFSASLEVDDNSNKG